MPTVPLLAAPLAEGDGTRPVRAPGGYECCMLCGHDAASGVFYEAAIWEGYSFDPGYRRLYQRYRAQPTRCRPPVPQECPVITLSLWHHGRLIQRTWERLAGDMERAEDGTWTLKARAGEEQILLRCPGPSAARPGAHRVLAGDGEHWATLHGLGQAELDLRVDGRIVSLSGSCLRQHLLGGQPIGWGRGVWLRGWVVTKSAGLVFWLTAAGRAGGEGQASVLDMDSAGACRAQSPAARITAWSGGLRPFPAAIECESVLSLDQPRVLGRSALRAHLAYRAKFAAGEGMAYCERAFGERSWWR